jgi:membrane protein
LVKGEGDGALATATDTARPEPTSRLLARVLAKSQRDELGLRASALAFSTLLALVPLIAVVSGLIARTRIFDDRKIVDALIELLPYREETILAALQSFLDQTDSISGIAIIGFAVTGLSIFLGVQTTLFRVFGVDSPPSFWRRLVTFSMLFFWGPLLVGFAQAGLLVVSQTRPELARRLDESLFFGLLPLLVTFFGLAMLYYRAAFSRIRFRHAAAGSLLATLGIELLTEAFQIYVVQFTAVQRAVYGTFAIALFFVLSVHISWWILLVGAELAACLGIAPEPPRRTSPDKWLGLAALELAAARRKAPPALAALARVLEVERAALIDHLRPLAVAGLVEPLGPGDVPVRLAVAPRRLRLAMLFAAYRNFADAAAPPAGSRAAELRDRLARVDERELAETTLADLLRRDADAPESAEDELDESTGDRALAALDRPEGRG